MVGHKSHPEDFKKAEVGKVGMKEGGGISGKGEPGGERGQYRYDKECPAINQAPPKSTQQHPLLLSHLFFPGMSRSPSPEFSPLAIDPDLTPLPTYKEASTTTISFSNLLSTPLKLHEDLTSGCGGQLWPAGMVLAKYMLRYHRDDLDDAKMFVSPHFLFLLFIRIPSKSPHFHSRKEKHTYIPTYPPPSNMKYYQRLKRDS
jgi:hypothetical protein